MIVKVQLPIFPEGAQALIYSKGRKNWTMVDQDTLPAAVLAAARGGKAYFHVQRVGGVWKYGEQAPAQSW